MRLEKKPEEFKLLGTESNFTKILKVVILETASPEQTDPCIIQKLDLPSSLNCLHIKF